jgi:hypothetical protein
MQADEMAQHHLLYLFTSKSKPIFDENGWRFKNVNFSIESLSLEIFNFRWEKKTSARKRKKNIQNLKIRPRPPYSTTCLLNI